MKFKYKNRKHDQIQFPFENANTLVIIRDGQKTGLPLSHDHPRNHISGFGGSGIESKFNPGICFSLP